MKQGIPDIKIIKEILEKSTANAIASGTGINLSTVKKLKSGERAVEKLNLADAIKITEFGMKNMPTKIEIWNSSFSDLSAALPKHIGISPPPSNGGPIWLRKYHYHSLDFHIKICLSKDNLVMA
ncbi:hypothetical protein [Mammaliicoccus sciuri]|uniref:hypothetical protein n=1 Tax=Mammaliicoccus sciuri TaxID=1296 RepID=UPI0008F67CC0|nr:hypothetical protein [Mammaliicoccus sciuri]SFV44183.1 Hypothetical protein SSCIU_00975 [Mammaliicoccus sciuri]